MRIAAFVRNSIGLIGSKNGHWLVLFSLAVGVSLAWTYTPLFLTPLGVGMGSTLFGVDGQVVAFFATAALTFLADAFLSDRPRAQALFSYGLPLAVVGVVGGALLVVAYLMGPASGRQDLELTARVVGCCGAVLTAYPSTCAVLQASRLLKRLSPARSVVACTGAFVVAACIVVCAAFVSGATACAAIALAPLASWVLGHMADARVPYADLSRPGEKSLTLVPLKPRDTWRYGAILLGLFLMGGWAINYAGQYDHLPQGLPAAATALQSVAVLVVFTLVTAVFNSTERPIGYDTICRVCVPAVALSILLEFLPEGNAGYLDDLGVCLTFVALLTSDLMCWVIHVCTARDKQLAGENARAFAVVRAMTCLGVMCAHVVTHAFEWAPLDKPKVAMTIGFLMLIVTIVCLPGATGKVASVAAVQPTPLRDLDEEKRSNLSALIVSHGLTAREAEVFALLMDDLDAAAIAERLGVSGATVHTHVSHVYTKFSVHSRKELERAVRAQEG